MGLAASQGRYLSLTARNSDLIREGQQISQQRLNIAKQSIDASEKYNDAMSNRIMQARTPEGTTQQLTYEILTSQDPFTGLCMRLVDTDGNVVVPTQGYTLDVEYTDEDGNNKKYTVTSADEFITKYMPKLDDDQKSQLRNKNLEELSQYYLNEYPDHEYTITVKNKRNDNLRKPNEHFLQDDNCLDPKYMQEMITTGQWIIQQANLSEEGWENTVWQGSSSITEIYDESDDAAAEAEYETKTKELQKMDKLLELKLEQVQTEQKAVETELDTIKDVIGKNIEDSFGTFA